MHKQQYMSKCSRDRCYVNCWINLDWFYSSACMLPQWPANCCCWWYKGTHFRPVDTLLSPQWQPALLTAAFVRGVQSLWRGLQWELVVITGPLVLSEMLSNQHSHYWVTWHLLPDKAAPPSPPPPPPRSSLLWMNASPSFSLRCWQNEAWPSSDLHEHNNNGMCSMGVCVCVCRWGSK